MCPTQTNGSRLVRVIKLFHVFKFKDKVQKGLYKTSIDFLVMSSNSNLYTGHPIEHFQQKKE